VWALPELVEAAMHVGDKPLDRFAIQVVGAGAVAQQCPGAGLDAKREVIAGRLGRVREPLERIACEFGARSSGIDVGLRGVAAASFAACTTSLSPRTGADQGTTGLFPGEPRVFPSVAVASALTTNVHRIG
jgi:hypothetical protein